MESLKCAGFDFFNNFDSANLARVEQVPLDELVCSEVCNNTNKSGLSDTIEIEFNIWTKPDCAGTEFENGNRTWFYFGMRANSSSVYVKLNIVDLNRQAKMYSQGMAPVCKVVPGKPHWERIRDKPLYATDGNIFTLSFKYKTPENAQSITYFAFTYPFSYTELQQMLDNIDRRFANAKSYSKDDIYYTRECVCHTLEGRRVDLLTISSYHNMTSEREPRLKNLFPYENIPRPFTFTGKKVIFVSARVHPGETPSSFVFNGLLNLLLNREDSVAVMLRRLYVFKMIPFLNPDGVARGHYRTDTRGVNLNRVYLRPVFELHPSIFASRSLIRYHHFGYEKEEEEEPRIVTDVSHMTLEEKESRCEKYQKGMFDGSSNLIVYNAENEVCRCSSSKEKVEGDANANESGLFLYLDMHGHASKKGIFMYGNHLDDIECNVECMLLPKIMSLNNHNFHFTACNFTERNMYLKDRRDGMSREGSGRVAVLKLTGLIRSYTLECNYNSGRLVNILPPPVREINAKPHTLLVPPKYTPQIFEEVGRALGASILDLTGQNPVTRIPNSEFHSLGGLRDWLRINCLNELGEPRTAASTKGRLKNSASLHAQGRAVRAVFVKARSSGAVPRKPPAAPGNPARVSRESAGDSAPCSSSSRAARPPLRPRSRRDALRCRRPPTMAARRTVPAPSSSPASACPKLREIRLVRDGAGAKRVIARYAEGRADAGEELVVAWDGPGARPTVFSQRRGAPGVAPEPSCSSRGQQGGFRVHNFARTASFVKAKVGKRPLRRIATAVEGTQPKVEKKRKKAKGKAQ